jgi:hypothetical protein
VKSEESQNRAADCAPCAGSDYLMLKEQISELDDMVLEDGKKDESDKTKDE